MWHLERTRRRRLALGAGLLTAMLLAGCRQGMYNQPKFTPYELAPDLPNATSAQHPPPGTVARDDPVHPPPDHFPLTLTQKLLQRGQERFDIYCAPCHGLTGRGHGMIVRRGFPEPPSLMDHDLRVKATDKDLFDVITYGHGVMYSYAARVTPHDRWAIVAYIRALQLSQHAKLSDLPPTLGKKELK